MSNLQVVDGNQQDRSASFELISNVTSPQTLFAIRTKSEFYYGSNAGTLENYTFTIDCVANGINNTLTIPGPTQLSNVAPSILGNLFVPKLGPPDNLQPFSFYFPGTPPYEFDLGSLANVPGGTNQICAFEIQNGTLISGKIKSETLVVLSIEGGPPNIDLTTLTPLCISYTTSNGFTLRYTDLPASFATYKFNVKVFDTIVGGGVGQYLPGGSTAVATSIGNNVLEFSFTFKVT
jgi:hypothetical protein